MKTIYKYTFPKVYGEVSIEVPEDARLLKMGVQTLPVAWFLVDTDNPNEEWPFVGFLTGEPLPDDINEEFSYRGTTDYNGFITHWFVRFDE